MHNFRVTKIAALAVMLLSCVAPAAHAAGMRDLAPADEYFGQLKMSVLGIRNELNGLERRAAGGDRNVAAMSGKLAFVDDALRDWRRHYPRDNWLPRYEAQRARVAALIAYGASSPGQRFAPAAGAAVQLLGTLHR
jgi:hypothetical protein